VPDDGSDEPKHALNNKFKNTVFVVEIRTEMCRLVGF
jgi:hypothetical protein